MVERISGPNYQSSRAGKINPTGSGTDFRFRNELAKVLKKIKSQLHEIEGMRGVYSFNPQTFASLKFNITDKAV